MPSRRLSLAALLAASLKADDAWAQTRPTAVVTIGAEDDWFPYSALQQGKAAGLSVDLVRAAFAATGVQANFVALPYARCMAQTKGGSLVACFNTTRTELIETDYLWPAQPMFEERFLIYARADRASAVRPLKAKDLEEHQVAVTRGYEYGTAFDSNTRIRRIITNHDERNFRLVLMGRADYTLAPAVNTRLLFQRQPELAGRFKVVGQLESFGLYTVFSRHHPQGPAMLAAFDQGMGLIRASGVAQDVLERWRRSHGAASP